MSIYILSDKEVAGAKNLPVIKIDFLVPDFSFEGYDAFIFTSKNSVKATGSLFGEWKNYPSFAIGEATAIEIKRNGGRVSFCCNDAYGKSLAEEISRKYSSLKFVYPRAKIVAFDLCASLREKNIQVEDIVVYETACSDISLEAPEDGSVIIFSSPSTIECFFKKFTWRDGYKAVVLGKTTAGFMPENISYEISPEQNLIAAVEFSNNLL